MAEYALLAAPAAAYAVGSYALGKQVDWLDVGVSTIAVPYAVDMVAGSALNVDFITPNIIPAGAAAISSYVFSGDIIKAGIAGVSVAALRPI